MNIHFSFTFSLNTWSYIRNIDIGKNKSIKTTTYGVLSYVEKPVGAPERPVFASPPLRGCVRQLDIGLGLSMSKWYPYIIYSVWYFLCSRSNLFIKKQENIPPPLRGSVRQLDIGALLEQHITCSVWYFLCSRCNLF